MKSVLTIVLFIGLSLGLWAQKLSISAKVDTNSILIGQQFSLSLTGIAEDDNFIWPSLPDTLEGLELVSQGKLDTIKKTEGFYLSQQFIFTSFDSGYFVIPPFVFNQEGLQAESEVIAIAVQFPELNEEDEYYDIKGILEPGLDWKKILLIVALSLVFLGGILFLIIRVHLKKTAAVNAPKYILKPFAQALKDLDELEKEQIWQKGEVKNYYSRLTDILELYLERQLKISAVEKTSDEIIEGLQGIRMKKEFFLEISAMLKTSSFVKFAKAKPMDFENEQALKIVREFIEVTKPQQELKKEGEND